MNGSLCLPQNIDPTHGSYSAQMNYLPRTYVCRITNTNFYVRVTISGEFMNYSTAYFVNNSTGICYEVDLGTFGGEHFFTQRYIPTPSPIN
jgi:hypothetical protein